MASQLFEGWPPADPRNQIAKMNVQRFRDFCETCPGFDNFFPPEELNELVKFNVSGIRALKFTVDMWMNMGLSKATAVALMMFIDFVTRQDPTTTINVIPDFIIRTRNEEWEWTQRLFYMTKACPQDVDSYTSMEIRNIPLFTPPELRSTRLLMNDDDLSFRYYGRDLFKRLSNKVNEMRACGGRFLYLHGTSGAGKSHVLAAFTAYLVAQGERVVFLADCRSLAPEPVSSIRSALFLAFADEAGVVSEVMKIVDKESLQEFCRIIGRRKLVFIIDQVNALDAATDSSDKVTEEQKNFTRTILDTITRYHFKIHSASWNYRHGEGDRLRLSGHERMEVHGGLTDTEAKRWWTSVKLGKAWGDLLLQKHREDIEVYTGMVPTLLAELTAAPSPESALSHMPEETVSKAIRDHLIDLVDGSSAVSGWRGMVSDFMITQIERVKGTGREDPFFRAIECCVAESFADDMTWPLIDHRFMFVAGGVGRCSGGVLMRRVITKYLQNRSMTLFNGTRWYMTLRGTLNPTVLGFLIKQMTLSWIASHGCPLLDINSSPPTCVFPGHTPPLDLGNQYFAIPELFNFPFVDAVYWKLTAKKAPDGKRIVRFIGFQVTLQDWKAHSEAEGPFLDAAGKWVSDRGWVGEWEIVWLVEGRKERQQLKSTIKGETKEEYEARLRTPSRKQKKRKVDELECTDTMNDDANMYGQRPQFIRHIITINEVAPRIGAKLRAVRKANKGGAGYCCVAHADSSSDSTTEPISSEMRMIL